MKSTRISRISEESILKYTFTPAQFNRNNKNPVIGKRFIPESLVTRPAGQGERRLWERDCSTSGRGARFPPRFRPVGRFCELRFRYLSSPTGREGEISRPLDHMRHIPFIHSARLKDSTNFYIYRTFF